MVEDSPQKFDAIVVGAGPGGCSCAAHLSKAGRRMLLLDKEHFPREKTCGDGISGKGISMLEELGLNDEIEQTPHRSITGVTFSSPDGSVVEIPLPMKEGKSLMDTAFSASYSITSCFETPRDSRRGRLRVSR